MDQQLYLALKALHMLGVVMFVGNILVGFWWKLMADRNGQPAVVAFAQQQIKKTDFVFTTLGIALMLAGGIPASQMLINAGETNLAWLGWGVGLLIASGIVWGAVMLPVQAKQAKIIAAHADAQYLPAEYFRLSKLWLASGVVAKLLVLFSIYWMVFKPY